MQLFAFLEAQVARAGASFDGKQTDYQMPEQEKEIRR